MALTSEQRAKLRQRLVREFARRGLVVNFTRPQIDAAIQAVIDRLELPQTQTTISNDIEAVAPGVFSAAKKRVIFLLATIQVVTGEGM